MKEFEKWWRHQYYSTSDGCMIAAEDGWKAALEWVLSKKHTILFAKEKEGVGQPITLVETDIIKEELNESQ